jgi:hypothetical protein
MMCIVLRQLTQSDNVVWEMTCMVSALIFTQDVLEGTVVEDSTQGETIFLIHVTFLAAEPTTTL